MTIAGGHEPRGQLLDTSDDVATRELAREVGLKTGAPLAEIDWTTVYGSGPKGYSDYPALQLESV